MEKKNKKMTDVFPHLKLSAGLTDLMEISEVIRVTMNPENTMMCVYLLSQQWIAKEDIYRLEECIENQLFKNVKLKVKIIEKFHLSRQYSVENFFDLYRPSILLELERYNKVLYSLMRNAGVSFPGPSTMRLVLPDSVIAKDRCGQLQSILEKIFAQRCGLDFHLHLDFKDPADKEEREEAGRRHTREYVGRLLRRAGHVLAEKEDTADKEKQRTAPAKKTAGKVAGPSREAASAISTAGGFAGRGGSGQGPKERRFSRPLKRSDNPDVIYGRDPEEQPVTIESIIGEMGDVTIRGQVLTLETREIRNGKTILMFHVTDFTDTITVKMFLENEQVPEITGRLKKGGFVKIKGRTAIDRFDHELSIASVLGLKSIGSFLTVREDKAPKKRVELHCHTKMSDMDGVSDAKAIISRACHCHHRSRRGAGVSRGQSHLRSPGRGS